MYVAKTNVSYVECRFSNHAAHFIFPVLEQGWKFDTCSCYKNDNFVLNLSFVCSEYTTWVKVGIASLRKFYQHLPTIYVQKQNKIKCLPTFYYAKVGFNEPLIHVCFNICF